ncbi:MAG: LLM class flavin-dependent oxidoreductase [Alphaproteobacteria bacterium]|nr:LLM class flavin-dependent oxidoreductase [Alphaproteobacteria bacterium]
MEFGMFHEFPPVGDGGQAVAFDQALEQVEMADRWGLDAMWREDPARAGVDRDAPPLRGGDATVPLRMRRG